MKDSKDYKNFDRKENLKLALKLQQLADKVCVTVRTINSIEREQYSPSLMLAYRIAQLFGVTIEELCCLKENQALEEKNENKK